MRKRLLERPRASSSSASQRSSSSSGGGSSGRGSRRRRAGMAARQIAHLGASAAAQAATAAGAGCFDAAQSGGSLWVAVKTGEHRIQVRLAAPSSGECGGTLHSTLQLPEPVALAQLGVPVEGDAAAGMAVLLVVGSSRRVWAFQLQPPAAGAASGPTVAAVALQADPAAAVLVPVAQGQCPGRHQLAAAVAWEHLCFSWDPSAATAPAVTTAVQPSNGSRSSRGRAGGASAGAHIADINLSKLQAALDAVVGREAQQRQQQQQLVHSVTSWVCRPAAVGGIPADAVAAAYVSAASLPAGSSSGSSGHSPRLACSGRSEFPETAATGGGASSSGPPGYLVVASSAGQLLALPVGTPCYSEHQPAGQAAPAERLPAVACFTSNNICFLPVAATPAASSSSGPPQRALLLLAESGRLVTAASAGMGASGAVVVSAGHGDCGDGSTSSAASGATSAAHVFAAVVQLVGASAAAAVASCLCYLPLATQSRLCCLDAIQGLQVSAAVVELPAGESARVGQPLLLTAAARQPRSRQQQLQLLLLTDQGALLAIDAPASASSGCQQLAGRQVSARRLEGAVQVSGGDWLWARLLRYGAGRWRMHVQQHLRLRPSCLLQF